jgi:hypothetical protein
LPSLRRHVSYSVLADFRTRCGNSLEERRSMNASWASFSPQYPRVLTSSGKLSRPTLVTLSVYHWRGIKIAGMPDDTKPHFL